MRRTVATLALTVALLLAGCQPTGTGRIEEDDPRFDCRVHGNQQCGPTVNA